MSDGVQLKAEEPSGLQNGLSGLVCNLLYQSLSHKMDPLRHRRDLSVPGMAPGPEVARILSDGLLCSCVNFLRHIGKVQWSTEPASAPFSL